MAKVASKAEGAILDVIHETAAGLYRAGAIEKATLREFDAWCLTPVAEMAPGEIRALREREQVCQPVFAQYLNVRRDAVSK
jgi:putative transcriptional regulator